MDIKALTGARIAVAKLAGADGCWHHSDTALAAQVQDFLETLPAVFAELEQARFDLNEKTLTLHNVRDQLAQERALSDTRLLKIEKLQATTVTVSGEPSPAVSFRYLAFCHRCATTIPTGQAARDEHNAKCSHAHSTDAAGARLPTTSIGTPP